LFLIVFAGHERASTTHGSTLAVPKIKQIGVFTEKNVTFPDQAVTKIKAEGHLTHLRGSSVAVDTRFLFIFM